MFIRPLVFALLTSSILSSLAQIGIRNGVAAIVNDDVITLADIQQAVFPIQNLLVRQFGSNRALLQQKLEEAQREQLDELVKRKLILNEFAEAGFNLPESIINDEIERRIREQYGDRLTLTRTLREEGLTFEAYKKNVREQIIVSQMRSFHVKQDVIVSPYAIEKYYLKNIDTYKLEDQIKLRMIFVANEEQGSSMVAKKLAEDIVRKLKDGAPFGELAAIYSKDSFAKEGGDWGWRERGEFRKELSDKLFAMHKGELSPPIETPEGYFIVKLDDARVAHVTPLADVRDEIERTFRDQELARRSDQWIERLKRKSFVRYF